MGREIKRVPLDFDWPLDEVWQGYLMPDRLDETPCQVCWLPDDVYGHPHSDGLTPAARAVSDTFYPHQIVSAGAFRGARDHAERLAWYDKLGQVEVDNLLAKGRLQTLTPRMPTQDNPRDWEWLSLPRTAEEVNAEQHRGGFSGHDGINRHILVRFRCKVLGIPTECLACDGHGSNEAYSGQRAEAEAWEPTEPPTGDGWRLWETVTEGSPQSPVFSDAEALAQWLTTPEGGYVSGPSGRPMTIEQARWFIGEGWAPTGFVTASGVHDGASYVGVEAAVKDPFDT